MSRFNLLWHHCTQIAPANTPVFLVIVGSVRDQLMNDSAWHILLKERPGASVLRKLLAANNGTIIQREAGDCDWPTRKAFVFN